MGKIRIAALGDEKKQKQQKEKASVRREQKKARMGIPLPEKKPQAEKRVETAGAEPKPVKGAKKEVQAEKIEKKPTSKKKTALSKHPHSKRYLETLSSVDRKKVYPQNEALELAKKTANIKFVATIEAHFNLNKKLSVKSSDSLKFEKKAPLAHGKLGKANQKSEELKLALEKMIKTIRVGNIAKLTLSSSMGPGIKTEVK